MVNKQEKTIQISESLIFYITRLVKLVLYKMMCLVNNTNWSNISQQSLLWPLCATAGSLKPFEGTNGYTTGSIAAERRHIFAETTSTR